ncbi:MAG TPA: hypothetical protein VGB28_07340 [Actinomycetota bacterium]|jgi:hypothetical protein
MRNGRIFAALALAALTGAAVAPGAAVAQKAKKITYEALADGSGLQITLNPGGGGAQGGGGAITDARVTHKPLAEATGTGISGEEGSQSSASAPPDENPPANGEPFDPVGATDVLQITSDGGTGDAQAEADDGTPSSTSTATFGPSAITAGPDNTVGAAFIVSIGSLSTTSSAKGKGTDVSSTASSTKTTVTFDVLASFLGDLCDDLPEELQEPCETAVGGAEEGSTVTLAQILVSENDVACTWDGEEADATGKGSSLVLSVLGQEPQTINPGQAPQTFGADTELVSTVGAGTFGKETTGGKDSDEDSVNAIAGAAFANLFGGQVEILFSTSSCSISAEIPPDKVLAATGGPVLWYLLGGAALAAAALGVRRFLRHPA